MNPFKFENYRRAKCLTKMSNPDCVAGNRFRIRVISADGGPLID